MMKIILFMKNWVGDILFEIPALEMIQARYPRSEIVCIAPRRCREILQNHPAVSRVLTFDEKKDHRSLFARIRFVLQLRRERWDKAYLFHRSKTRALILWLAGVQERIGYANHRGFFLTKSFPAPEAPMHHVDYFVELLVRDGFPRPENPSYSFYVSAADAAAAGQILQKYQLESFVCFHLGANWEPKRWPPGHFAKLADLIFEKWKLPILVTGAPGDLPLAEAMSQKVEQARVIYLTGKTRLGELAAILQRALFVVSGDSGPMHIASAVGTKVVALFGPTDPKLTGPRGKSDLLILNYVPEGFSVPWYGKELPEGGWLSHISPENVLEEIEKKDWVKSTPSLSCSSVGAIHELPLQIKKERGSSIKKILLVTLSNIGDVIVTTPVLMTLARHFPSAKITVVVGPRARGILEGSRYIHRLIIYDKRASLHEKWHFLKELRRQTYDCVVDLRNTAIPFLVSAKKRSPLFRKFSHLTLRERHLAVLKKMGLEAEAVPAFDFFSPRDEKNILRRLKDKGVDFQKDWIVIAPFAADRLKTWPKEYFAEVIQQLARQRNENILLLGGTREKNLITDLVKIDPSKICSLAGETTLREAAAVLSRAALVLANDSSIMHLADELKRPLVAIFGPTDPLKSGPVGPFSQVIRAGVFCSPCNQSFCRFDRQACMEDLKPETVLKACLEILEKNTETRVCV